MSLSDSIDKLAEEELLMEAKRGAARASTSGAFGWQKCPLPKTNKRFLRNTLLQSLQSSRSPPKVYRQSKRSPKPKEKFIVEDKTVTSSTRELPQQKSRPRAEDKDEDSSRRKRRKDEKRNDERRYNGEVTSPQSEKSKKQKSKSRDKEHSHK